MLKLSLVTAMILTPMTEVYVTVIAADFDGNGGKPMAANRAVTFSKLYTECTGRCRSYA